MWPDFTPETAMFLVNPFGECMKLTKEMNLKSLLVSGWSLDAENTCTQEIRVASVDMNSWVDPSEESAHFTPNPNVDLKYADAYAINSFGECVKVKSEADVSSILAMDWVIDTTNYCMAKVVEDHNGMCFEIIDELDRESFLQDGYTPLDKDHCDN